MEPEGVIEVRLIPPTIIFQLLGKAVLVGILFLILHWGVSGIKPEPRIQLYYLA